MYQKIRDFAVQQSLNWITESTQNGYRGKIRSGLLKGYDLTVPQLERLSYFTGNYEPHIVQWLQTNVSLGQTVFDVGSNCGYLSMVIARLVSDEGCVFAFEPVKANADSIVQNISDNSILNMNLVQKAVGIHVGTVEFATYNSSLVGHISAYYDAADAIKVSVESTTLDSSVYGEGLPVPHVIKIDVEGGEGDVLLGASRLLKEHHPTIIAEVWNDEGEFAPILSYMQKLGYDYRFLQGGFDMDSDEIGDVVFFPK